MDATRKIIIIDGATSADVNNVLAWVTSSRKRSTSDLHICDVDVKKSHDRPEQRPPAQDSQVQDCSVNPSLIPPAQPVKPTVIHPVQLAGNPVMPFVMPPAQLAGKPVTSTVMHPVMPPVLHLEMPPAHDSESEDWSGQEPPEQQMEEVQRQASPRALAKEKIMEEKWAKKEEKLLAKMAKEEKIKAEKAHRKQVKQELKTAKQEKAKLEKLAMKETKKIDKAAQVKADKLAKGEDKVTQRVGRARKDAEVQILKRRLQ